jgi:hypothetical protein
MRIAIAEWEIFIDPIKSSFAREGLLLCLFHATQPTLDQVTSIGFYDGSSSGHNVASQP